MVFRTPKNRPLNEREATLLGAYVAAAEQGLPKPSIEELADLCGVSNSGAIPDMTRRLEAMGLITRTVFQRGSQICIVKSGKCTAMPKNTTPHWRDRPRETPSVLIKTIKNRQPETEIADEIMRWANSRGTALCDAIADLVYVGWQVEKERG